MQTKTMNKKLMDVPGVKDVIKAAAMQLAEQFEKPQDGNLDDMFDVERAVEEADLTGDCELFLELQENLQRELCIAIALNHGITDIGDMDEREENDPQ